MSTTQIAAARTMILSLALASLALPAHGANGRGAKPGAELWVSPAAMTSRRNLASAAANTGAGTQTVRELKARNHGQLPAGGVTIWLRGGRYELRQTFTLEGEDSDRKGGRWPIARTARRSRCSAWPDDPRMAEVEGDLGGRLPWRPWERSGRRPCPRRKTGPAVPQLWLGGNRLPRARWPNAPLPGKDAVQAAPKGDSYATIRRFPGWPSCAPSTTWIRFQPPR